MSDNSLCERLKIKYPIIQAPMAGGIISPEVVSKVSNFGMLGSIPSGYLTIDDIEKFIVEVKSKTSHSFQVNVFADYNEYNLLNLKKPEEIISIEREIGMYESDFFDIPSQSKVSEIVQLTIDHKVRILSTTFGIFNSDDIEKLKRAGVRIMTTINNLEELKIAVSDGGSDVIVFQNSDAGGHVGGFISESSHSDFLSVDNLKREYPSIYIIKSGGVIDKSGVKSALNDSYDGVQIGTGFLMTQESTANDLYKNVLVETKNQDDIIFTSSITGKMAKGIKNKLSSLEIKGKVEYPFLHYATKGIRNFAKGKSMREYQSFWTGKGAIEINEINSLEDFMSSLI
ncbi:NAD(P)H-dependent flavin oxidoreductase [Ichthyobacterium seriolicida]|uniref:Propionate 3-nitronate monooxygenase n=1 Tax=Ichthyobacterium seriolicida TaxID=242600 RepID=A0A1J1EAP1_9FLAO|nr:nitronate monooxygenase [Ichthyobacterium seriolicida]BAV94584.1 2-nitropropane dioxygenase [Ichthyobacterium seriolicida]